MLCGMVWRTITSRLDGPHLLHMVHTWLMTHMDKHANVLGVCSAVGHGVLGCTLVGLVLTLAGEQDTTCTISVLLFVFVRVAVFCVRNPP